MTPALVAAFAGAASVPFIFVWLAQPPRRDPGPRVLPRGELIPISRSVR